MAKFSYGYFGNILYTITCIKNKLLFIYEHIVQI